MAILSEESTIYASNHGEIDTYKLFNDESADETTSDAVFVGDAEAITLLVETGAGVSGGVIELEAARTSDYAGTWKQLTTLTLDAASKVFAISVAGGNNISTNIGLPQLYVRARISTIMSGGTIDVYLIKKK